MLAAMGADLAADPGWEERAARVLRAQLRRQLTMIITPFCTVSAQKGVMIMSGGGRQASGVRRG
jgi:hypothetical protein